jgi:hypothetical protein
MESNHLDVKAQVTRTQMNRELLDAQIGTRLVEAYIVNYGHDRVCNQDQLPAAPDTSETCGRGTQSSAETLVLTRSTCNQLASEFVWTSARVGCPPVSLHGDRVPREYPLRIL